MFGNEAPIWRFLDRIGATQDPMAARDAAAGIFVMEVFPALALPAMIPAIWERGHGAKYNPKARLFRPSDWPLVCLGVAAHASAIGRLEISLCAESLAIVAAPTKGDQDRLDALICLLIGLGWRRLPTEDGLFLGDLDSGYIVMPVSPDTRAWLVAPASRQRVPVDGAWTRADRDVGVGERVSAVVAVADAPLGKSPAPARVQVDALRILLVERAKTGSPISYGEVAGAFDHRWSQGFGASLKVALGAIDAGNLAAGEPRLMCLVVNATSRKPGEGFFEMLGEGASGGDRRREVLEIEVSKCAAWRWD